MANDAGVREIGPDQYEVQEGYVGNLNDDQLKALVKMWESFFDICDRAQGSSKKGEGKFEEMDAGGGNSKDLKKSGIPEDDKAKEEAKKMSEQQGMTDLLKAYGPEALRDSWWSYNKGDDPDGNMLRFIRARKWEVERGLAMMATCLKWRLDSDVDSLVMKGDLTNAEEIPKFIDQQKSGKVFSYGFTLKGQPICYVLMKYHSIWGQPAASMQKFIVTQMETFRTLICPPNDKATIFFDLKGFGIKQMDVVNLIYLVKVLESYYPESLGTMYVSNAPLIFWGFWRGVKNFLDPVVRNKIVFIEGPKDTTHDVPGERIIKYCGGDSMAEFKFVEPQEGENHLTEDEGEKGKRWQRHQGITNEFERVTREWCKSGGKDESLTEQRKVLVKKLRLSSYEIDPYFRGRNQYQRDGTIPSKHQGMCSFDYVLDGETIRQVLGHKSSRKSIERELAEIADGSSVSQAEAKTQEMLKDGTWGDWRVNDNNPEVQKKALASLSQFGGKESKETEQITQPAPEQEATGGNNSETAAAQSSDDSKDATAGAAAAGGAAAAAGGGAAAAAAASSNANDSEFKDAPETPKDAAAAANGEPVAPKPASNGQAKSSDAAASKSSSASPSEPKQQQRKSSILTKVKSKIMA